MACQREHALQESYGLPVLAATSNTVITALALYSFFIAPYTGSTQTTQTQTAKIHLKYIKNTKTSIQI